MGYLLLDRINRHAFAGLQSQNTVAKYNNSLLLLAEEKPSLRRFDNDGNRILLNYMHQLSNLFQPDQFCNCSGKIPKYFSNRFVRTCSVWANFFDLHRDKAPEKREILDQCRQKKVSGNISWSWSWDGTKGANSPHLLPGAPINTRFDSRHNEERPLHVDLLSNVFYHCCSDSSRLCRWEKRLELENCRAIEWNHNHARAVLHDVFFLIRAGPWSKV